MPVQPSPSNDWGDPTQHDEDFALSISALSLNSSMDSPQSIIAPAGGSVGPYRLLRQIGSGGMGEVWLASQSEPVYRQVALKLIKAGMDTREVVARFQSERQALALMDHPSIAKVFEAGSTQQGRPYFAMEFITGIPITQFCDEHKMSVRRRLELFVQVCDAVQHAHQKAIIHRDLKPSNILVSEVDGKPLARIIDFGIAKAISQGLLAETQYTQTGAILGTPAYMSPEQARSVGLDVDTRTDVYSLGVILYELLVGVRPIDPPSGSREAWLQRLREEESPRPSARIRAILGVSTVTAENRQAEPLSLVRLLRGDLDAIALKALEKDRSRRYASPSDLASDIGRYLHHEAVQAVAPSLSYRAGKFALRYRAAFAVVSICLLTLILAAFISIWQSVRATKQRDRADAEAATAQAVSEFLQNDLLSQASAWVQLTPSAKADPDLKVRTVLDRAAARIAGRFDHQPEVEAAVRDTIGRTYLALGLYRASLEQFSLAFDLHRRVLGPDHPITMRTGCLLAGAITAEGRYTEAESRFREIVDAQKRILGPLHPDTLSSMFGLAVVYREQAKYAQAEAIFTQLSQIEPRVWGDEDARTLFSVDRLADVFYREGEYARAGQLLAHVLEIRRRVLGQDHPDTTMSMSALAAVHSSQGNFSAAESLDRQMLEIRTRVLGPEHPFALAAMNNLAVEFSNQGKFAQALELNRRTFEIRRRVIGPEFPETLMSMENLACSYADLGKYSKAEALFTQALQADRRVMGVQSIVTLSTISDAAFLYQREGKYAQAEKYATEVLAARRRSLGSDSSITIEAAADLLTSRLSQRKFAESRSLAEEVVAFYRKNRPHDWQRFRAESLLGVSLAGEKKFSEGEPLLREGYLGMLALRDRIPVSNQYHLQLAHKWLKQFEQTTLPPEAQ